MTEVVAPSRATTKNCGAFDCERPTSAPSFDLFEFFDVDEVLGSPSGALGADELVDTDDERSVSADVNNGPPTNPFTDVAGLAIDVKSPGTLYAATTNFGVFKSTDGASTWRPLNTGLANSFVNALAIEATAPFRLYAGTKGSGVFALEQHSACVGDCNDDEHVTVAEVVAMVNIALGSADIGTCPAGDANHDGPVTIDEIIVGVHSALTGCPGRVLDTISSAQGASRRR